MAVGPRCAVTIPILLAPRHNQPRGLLDKAPVQRPPPRKTKRNSHPTFHHTSPARLHQQVPSHLRKRYHAANTNRSSSSLITNYKLEIPKRCAKYSQVSILGIWNSHSEPVSLTMAKLACAFWHTLGTCHKNRCHTHTSCTHRDEMSQCSSHYFVRQLNSKTNH